ncbi:cytochrome-c oxidase, cbb3-type subunit III [Azohydromonas sediminis]|uniref:cytochrome-c oxidase, cbb3-type subunit III n=1 Tax=Azohydromonas sediminis TaxID=2259674 RepID=UPI000E65D4AA|nr:cytochrome-c oxidase, cbb3-type subunit III [Azohydromonas sediminis]
MSDFFNSGWSIFVAAVTIISLIACLVLLLAAAKRRVMASDNTTGHVWDEDLREMNNPLPRWWMGLFVITVIFGAVYLALYPGLGSFQGAANWSSVDQYQKERAKLEASMAPVYARFANLSAEELAKDSQAMEIGQRLFLNNCAQCHGSDARGSLGFPNLTDAEWMWGGSHEQIKETITNGRNGVMPPMAAAVGTADDVRNVAHYVLSLSGSTHNPVYAQLGQPKFAACAACHGADGKGNQAMGAPDLTNNVWLHGWGEQAIVRAINNGFNNAMPAQARLLTPEQIHVLGAYVWRLSQPTQVAKQP